LPSLAVAIGLNEAIFLQQLHYWLTPTVKYKPHYREYKDVSRPWVYNTYHAKEETGWQANFPFWSVRTIKRIVTNLKVKGLIIVTDKFNSASSNRTLWYTIDYDKLATYETSGTLDSDKLALSESDKVSPSRGGQVGTLMTETTTETTPDINGSAKKSQNQKTEYTFSERQALNKLAPIFATQCGDQFSKDELKNYIKLGYQLTKEVCPLNVIGASLKSLQDLARAALIIEDYSDKDEILKSFKSWWYNEYWLGRDKGQPPTPAQVGDTWGQFEAAQSTPTSPAGPELSDTAKANYARLLAQSQP
jgi:hypothetical protein